MKHRLSHTPAESAVQSALTNSFGVDGKFHGLVVKLPNFGWSHPSIESSLININDRLFLSHCLCKLQSIAAALLLQLLLVLQSVSIHLVWLAVLDVISKVVIPQKSL